MSVLATEDMCLVSTTDICPVSAADICPVSTADICPVSTEDIYPVSTDDIKSLPAEAAVAADSYWSPGAVSQKKFTTVGKGCIRDKT